MTRIEWWWHHRRSKARILALGGVFGSGVDEASVPRSQPDGVDLRALEAAAAGGRPLLWLASLVALGIAVTR